MEQTFFDAGTSKNLYGTVWTATDQPRGAMIVVHGLGDHIGRYETFAQAMVQHEWAVCGFDLPGHGRSPGKRGRVGKYDQLLADIGSVCQHAGKQFALAPQAILGHSMGGNLALNYALRCEEFSSNLPPAGLALISPLVLPPGTHTRTNVLAAWLTGHLFPRRRIQRAVDLQKLTRDPKHAAEHKNDPLTHSRIGLKLGTQLLAQGRWALDHAREVDVPTLIMNGDDDQLIDQSACAHLAMRIGQNAEHVKWPSMRHNLFHDVGSDQVISTLSVWLKQQPAFAPTR